MTGHLGIVKLCYCKSENEITTLEKYLVFIN